MAKEVEGFSQSELFPGCLRFWDLSAGLDVPLIDLESQPDLVRWHVKGGIQTGQLAQKQITHEDGIIETVVFKAPTPQIVSQEPEKVLVKK